MYIVHVNMYIQVYSCTWWCVEGMGVHPLQVFQIQVSQINTNVHVF